MYHNVGIPDAFYCVKQWTSLRHGFPFSAWDVQIRVENKRVHAERVWIVSVPQTEKNSAWNYYVLHWESHKVIRLFWSYFSSHTCRSKIGNRRNMAWSGTRIDWDDSEMSEGKCITEVEKILPWSVQVVFDVWKWFYLIKRLQCRGQCFKVKNCEWPCKCWWLSEQRNISNIENIPRLTCVTLFQYQYFYRS